MSEFDYRKEERKSRWEERKMHWEARAEFRHSGKGHIWTGVLLLIIGTAALLKSFMVPMPVWIFSWQMLLIVLGIFIGLRHRFHGPAWFILIIIGGAFMASEYFVDVELRRHVWPLVLISLGMFFILRSGRKNWQNSFEKKSDAAPDGTSPLTEGSYSQEDFIDATSIFGGTKKIILSKNFKGGDVVNVFGGTELNLTQADIDRTATLELTTIFGGTKLIVPSNWSVKSEAVTIFGGIEDKRQLPSSTEVPEKILLLKGTVIFGGIDIKSF